MNNPLEILLRDLGTIKQWSSSLEAVLKQAREVLSQEAPAQVPPKYLAKIARGFVELAEIRETNDRALREDISQQERIIRTQIQGQAKKIYRLLEEFRSYLKVT